jgi:hypothetical protein
MKAESGKGKEKAKRKARGNRRKDVVCRLGVNLFL